MTRRVEIDPQVWPEVKFMVEEVVKARKAAGLTQVKAAKAIGTGQSYIAALEGGFVNPTFQLLAQMARVYKVPMTTFCPTETVRKRPNVPRRQAPPPPGPTLAWSKDAESADERTEPKATE